MASKKSVKLSHTLVEAVKERRAVLVFGAEASKECKNDLGETPPNGDQMRDKLAKKFLGTTNETRNLMTVAQMAIPNSVGQPQVFEEIAKMVNGFNSSTAHRSIAGFSWRGMPPTRPAASFAVTSSTKVSAAPLPLVGSTLSLQRRRSC